MPHNPTFTKGHCLHCDLGTVLNTWVQSGDVKPQEVLEVLAEVSALAALHAAKAGCEDMIAEVFARLFKAYHGKHIAGGKMDNASPHMAGHA